MDKKVRQNPDLFYFYMVQRKDKKVSVADARQKIYRYCAYQERCHQEVKSKLYEYGITRQEVDEIMVDLITEGYLNEERFAKAFAGGKFRMKSWGRIKITHELEQRGLTAACIRSGLEEIESDAYEDALKRILRVKSSQVNGENEYVGKDKVATYAIQKGFEPELVWKLLKQKEAL